MKNVTKKVAHGEKNHKNAKKNLVKLPGSAQKVLLRASSLILFFVLISNNFQSRYVVV
jgi:hypothetical protein